jgi:ubiquinone/menaquinone biosynthesis C-methylase UbiE
MKFGTNFREIYDRLGTFYTRSHEGESAEARRKLIVKLIRQGKILEIGCAEGFMTGAILEKNVDLVAADISHNYIKRARRQFPQVKYLVMDAANMPLRDDIFDTVILSAVLEHVPEPYYLLEEVHRVLRNGPDTTLILVVPNVLSLSNISGHFLRMYEKYMNIYDGHINFYDYGSVLQLYKKIGFEPVRLYAPYFKIAKFDFLLDLFGLRRILQRYFPQFAHEILVMARKGDKPEYWEKVGAHLDKREATQG